MNRIVDNAHLLDATEIFRKLNVHKKVCGCVVKGGAQRQGLTRGNRNRSLSLVSISSCSSSIYTVMLSPLLQVWQGVELIERSMIVALIRDESP